MRIGLAAEQSTARSTPFGRGKVGSRGRCAAPGTAPSVLDMDILKKVFIASALACGASWLLKMVAIVATGGGDSEALIIGILWTTGMVSFLVASGTGVALLLGRAPVWARVVAGIIAVPASFVLLDVFDLAVVKPVYRVDGWFRDELALVIAAVVYGALGLRAASGTRQPSRQR